jgi:uncharacterized protein (DUF111 family)
MAFSFDRLFEAGALDVFAVPAVMKKGRAGHVLTALAHEADQEAVAKVMLRHTSTRGVRISYCGRMTLTYRHEKVETEYGGIDIKISSGHGITKIKPEYDSVASAAQKKGATFAEVRESALNAYLIQVLPGLRQQGHVIGGLDDKVIGAQAEGLFDILP